MKAVMVWNVNAPPADEVATNAMNTQDTIKAMIALHDENAIKQPGHVYEVWEDGEITLTKSGELYGLRNLHMIQPGLNRSLPWDSLPLKNTRHSRIATLSEATAVKARDLIRKLDVDEYHGLR
jgi:hypothetical protein